MVVKGDKMFDDENEGNEIILTDDEEELEKENNPIRLEFDKVKGSCKKIVCLLNIMLTALNNDFDETDTEDIIDYINLISEHVENHQNMLDRFFKSLDIPQGKAKLIGLKYYIRKE